jgi:hypothetical protein
MTGRCFWSMTVGGLKRGGFGRVTFGGRILVLIGGGTTTTGGVGGKMTTRGGGATISGGSGGGATKSGGVELSNTGRIVSMRLWKISGTPLASSE